jgi:hypothetical protein
MISSQAASIDCNRSILFKLSSIEQQDQIIQENQFFRNQIHQIEQEIAFLQQKYEKE